MVSKNALPHDPRTPVKSVKVMGKNRALLHHGKRKIKQREKHAGPLLGDWKGQVQKDARLAGAARQSHIGILTSLIEYSILNDLHV